MMPYLPHHQNGYRMSPQQMAPYMAAGGFMGGAMMGHVMGGHQAGQYGPAHAASHPHHHHAGGVPQPDAAALQRGVHPQGNMYPYGYGLVQQLNGGSMRR